MTTDDHLCHAWISPDGMIHEIPRTEHYTFASEQARHMYDGESVSDPVGLLEFLGWIHISFDEVYLTRRPTPAQESALTRIAQAFRWLHDWSELAAPMYADGRFEERRFHLVHFAKDGFCGSSQATYTPERIFPPSHIESMRLAVA